jgi:hypothetical protein
MLLAAVRAVYTYGGVVRCCRVGRCSWYTVQCIRAWACVCCGGLQCSGVLVWWQGGCGAGVVALRVRWCGAVCCWPQQFPFAVLP